MAFLDETGLAELWELIKAEDAKGLKVANGKFTATGSAQTITIGGKPRLVICLAVRGSGGGNWHCLKVSDGTYTAYTHSNGTNYSDGTSENDITFSAAGFTVSGTGYSSGTLVRYAAIYE